MDWVAHYSERKVTNVTAKYSQLERARLVAFDLVQNGQLRVRVDLQPDSRGPKALIFRRRNRRDSNGAELIWYIIGFKQGDCDHVLSVFEDGAILLGGQLEQGKLFHEPIAPFEWEMDLVR